MYSKLFGMYSGLVWDVYRVFWCFPFRFLMAFLKGFVVVGQFPFFLTHNVGHTTMEKMTHNNKAMRRRMMKRELMMRSMRKMRMTWRTNNMMMRIRTMRRRRIRRMMRMRTNMRRMMNMMMRRNIRRMRMKRRNIRIRIMMMKK